MSHLLESVPWDRRMLQIPALPFPHLFAPLDRNLSADPLQGAEITNRLYVEMLTCLGIEAVSQNGELRQSAPYNLLLTRRWMLLVPRAAEFYQSISVNALGFAGSLFVRNEKEMEIIRRQGPMEILTKVVTEKNTTRSKPSLICTKPGHPKPPPVSGQVASNQWPIPTKASYRDWF